MIFFKAECYASSSRDVKFSSFYQLVSEFVSDPLCEELVLVDFVAQEAR